VGFLKLVKQPGLKALYGPPLSFKTSLVITCLGAQKDKAAYIGLSKHAFLRYTGSSVDVFQVMSFRDAVNLLLDLMAEEQREWKLIIYDGFGSECMPLYCGLKERSVMQAALFIASALRLIAAKFLASVLVVTTETYKGRPLFYSALSKHVELFLRTDRGEDFIRASVLTPQLLEKHAYVIPLDLIRKHVH